MLEASLLLCFGFLGEQLSHIAGLFVPMTVMLLSFIMGLQNALVTKISHSEIRTTHVTGLVTDIGIEMGKAMYGLTTQPPNRLPVQANGPRLQILLLLAMSFFLGGVLGASIAEMPIRAMSTLNWRMKDSAASPTTPRSS